MKIEFENSSRRFSFLYHLPDVKIAWINPCQYTAIICKINLYCSEYKFADKYFKSNNSVLDNNYETQKPDASSLDIIVIRKTSGFQSKYQNI